MRMQTNEPGLEIYLRQIGELPLLSAAEERELALRIGEKDQEARERMIRTNLRLVVCVARRFLGRGLTLADLIAEGNIGLITAVDKFDASSGNRFSTYAVWWIRQAIRKALSTGVPSIHVPAYLAQRIAKFEAARARLYGELGQDPTLEELSDHLVWPVAQTRFVQRTADALRGLGQPASETAGTHLSAVVPDTGSVAPDERIVGREQLDRLAGLLHQVDARASAILQSRYGLSGGETQTLAQIGERIHLTRERVRQIEHETLSNLREQMLSSG